MKTLLFTGGSGFLGVNIRPTLDGLYDVTTCGISSSDDIKADLSKEIFSPIRTSCTAYIGKEDQSRFLSR